MAFGGTDVHAGDELDPLTVSLTRESVVRYSGASTDFNPIHYSDREATELGLDGVLVHGMWTMGTALRVVTDWCENPDRVASYSLRFTKPIFVPDTDDGVQVQFSGSVKSVEDGLATVVLDARAADQKVLGMVQVGVRLD